MHEIRIGVGTAEFLSLKLHGRQFPDATDYWYANWLTCDIQVAAGVFRGEFGMVIRNEDIGHFLIQLRPVYEKLSGSATLEGKEDWLCLDIVGDGRSDMKVEGRLCDNCNTLEFHLALDQTDLPAIIQRLEEICESYPIIGDPTA